MFNLAVQRRIQKISELYSCHVDTPEGVFLVHFSDRGIYELFFPGSEPDQDCPERPLPWPQFAIDLVCYLQGEKISWSEYPLDSSGYPPFVGAVLGQTNLIPWGETITYRQVAERAGSPLAWRAAGQALSKNRHPIIVPCHRVVGSDGKLGGFSGPEGWKKKLLELEGKRNCQG